MKSDFAVLHLSICPDVAVTGCAVPRKVRNPHQQPNKETWAHMEEKWNGTFAWVVPACERREQVKNTSGNWRTLSVSKPLLGDSYTVGTYFSSTCPPSPPPSPPSGFLLLWTPALQEQPFWFLNQESQRIQSIICQWWHLKSLWDRLFSGCWVESFHRSGLTYHEGQRGSCIICSSAFLCCPLTCHSTGPYSFLHMGLLIHSFRHLWTVCKVSGSTENTNRRC